ncbi:acyl-CoA thioesterase [Flavobacteriaceae bacterium 3-367]|uniref:acyl-CoA thioesterase n=1 Tax=Eudoraea algarum TaxID=3417568 RepID=UPI003287F929
MYLKEFEVRWSDVDANRHLANTAYINFMVHTRMCFLADQGFTHRIMAERNIGPVVFYEHMYYYKEVFPGQPVRVSLEVVGTSEDGKFFEFRHNFYDAKGMNFAHCEMMGAWMDLGQRKLVALEKDLLQMFSTVERATDFRVLTKEDTRRMSKFPKDLA